MSHDCFLRVLQKQPPDTATLWHEAKQYVTLTKGCLVLDDTTLDKPYAKKMPLVTWHWSGTHRRGVQGINLQTLLWTDGTACGPCACAVYDKPLGGRTKNEAFAAMLRTAKTRGFQPAYVLFDSWYSSLANLKLIRQLGWQWLTRFKKNRQVNPDRTGNRPIEQVAIPPEGRVVHLRGYGLIKVFRIEAKKGRVEYWATSNLALSPAQRATLAHHGWQIETYHRGLKQCCGVDRAQVRSVRGQLNHILLAIRAFLRLEGVRLRTGQSWYETKAQIVRQAIGQAIRDPTSRGC